MDICIYECMSMLCLCVCILIVTCAKVGKYGALGKIIDATEYYYYK